MKAIMHTGWTLGFLSIVGTVLALEEVVPVFTTGGGEDKSIQFKVFGQQYKLPLDPAKRSVSTAPVLTASNGRWKRSLPTQPVEVYRDGDTVVAVRQRDQLKRTTRAHHNSYLYDVDGIVVGGGDAVYVRSRPWLPSQHSLKKRDFRSRPHAVEKRNAGSFFPMRLDQDYVDTVSHLDSFVRRRRSGAVNAVVELLVIADNAVYRDWLQETGSEAEAIRAIEKYYNLLISLVDVRYAEIKDPDLQIRVKLAAVFVAQDRSDSLWSEQNIQRSGEETVLDPNVALSALREWLLKQEDQLPDYDHAMGFTGYNLVNKVGNPTSGMAYIGTICQLDTGYSCSIIEHMGGLLEVGTAAHELGHSLGAKHDGRDGNSACGAHENYIMAPAGTMLESVLQNYYSFSSCSIRQFKTLLSSESAECLADGELGQTGSALPGEVFTPETQCKQVFGQTSGLCPMEALQENICLQMWCIKPDNEFSCVTKGQLAAVYGSPCGDNKICRNGDCVDARSIEESGVQRHRGRNKAVNTHRVAFKPNHAFGGNNEPPPQIARTCREDVNAEYCRDLVYRSPDACRRQDIKDYCCYSCHYV